MDCAAGDVEVATCTPQAVAACPEGFAAITACSSSGSGGNDAGSLRSWALGTWYAPAYDDDSTGKHIPAKGLGITADGKYTHTTSGVQDDQGTWTMSGDSVTVGTHGTLDRAVNCGFINYSDGSRVDTYYRDDAPTECPDAIAPLSAVEKCLVGDFSQTTDQNLDRTIFKWHRTEFRNEVLDESYTQGNANITAIHEWSVVNGQLCTQGVDRQSGCVDIDWSMIDSTRVTAKAAGCVEP
jgi:hypothetical protein